MKTTIFKDVKLNSKIFIVICERKIENMPKKFVCRLTNPLTIVFMLIIWVLPFIPILISIVKKGSVDIIGVIILSPFIILLAPFAMRALFDRIIIMDEMVILKMVFKKNVTAKIIDIKKINGIPKKEKYGAFKGFEAKLSRIEFVDSDNKILMKFLLPGWKVEPKIVKIKEELKARGCKGLMVVNKETSDSNIFIL